MRERMDAWMGTRASRTQKRRVTRYMSLLVGVFMLVFFSAAQGAFAGKALTISPPEGCPGDIVTFTGTGFNTGAGSRPKIEWTDNGTKEQWKDVGGIDQDKISLSALSTTISTEQKAVVPMFFQVWEGPNGAHLAGEGTVKFEG